LLSLYFLRLQMECLTPAVTGRFTEKPCGREPVWCAAWLGL
jgi:hypothetical protein